MRARLLGVPVGRVLEYPWYAVQAEGFGSTYKREVKRRYPTPISFSIQAPSLPSPTNYMDLDPKVTDRYGIPVARMHFQWHENELAMFQHSKEACKELLHAAGGVFESAANDPNMPGWSLHEDRDVPHGQRPETLRDQSLRPDARRAQSLCLRCERVSEFDRQDDDAQHSDFQLADIGVPFSRTSTSGCIDVRNLAFLLLAATTAVHAGNVAPFLGRWDVTLVAPEREYPPGSRFRIPTASCKYASSEHFGDMHRVLPEAKFLGDRFVSSRQRKRRAKGRHGLRGPDGKGFARGRDASTGRISVEAARRTRARVDSLRGTRLG